MQRPEQAAYIQTAIIQPPTREYLIPMIDGDDISRPASTVWLTGLSGAGKTTLANTAALLCRQAGYPVCIIDGDQLRQGLCRDLGFDISDRSENVRRAAEMARLLNE